jgi:hypothetical protein
MKLNIFAAVALAGLPKITILVAQQKLLGNMYTKRFFEMHNKLHKN